MAWKPQPQAQPEPPKNLLTHCPGWSAIGHADHEANHCLPTVCADILGVEKLSLLRKVCKKVVLVQCANIFPSGCSSGFNFALLQYSACPCNAHSDCATPLSCIKGQDRTDILWKGSWKLSITCIQGRWLLSLWTSSERLYAFNLAMADETGGDTRWKTPC